eukprot:SAG11_NODE_36258_length_262_cov_1.269939_1_plen_52_part_10
MAYTRELFTLHEAERGHLAGKPSRGVCVDGGGGGGDRDRRPAEWWRLGKPGR